MAIRIPKSEQGQHEPVQRASTGPTLCARDRLLAVLEKTPCLSRMDAETINRAIREAREASLADELSA